MPGASSFAGAGGSRTLPSFMLVMLISGTFNTLLMKFMVMQKVPTGPTGAAVGFDHPYFQSLLMMIGEFLCLIAYFATRKPEAKAVTQNAPKSIFAVACLMDWTATTLVNMAYVLIAASVVQMTRGAIVIFTCLFSVLFLGRRQHGYHIMGVFLVFVGITLVSVSTLIGGGQEETSQQTHSRMIGIMLCLGAQVFQAAMLVYEEQIMSKYTLPPLLVVGMEGTFGILFGVMLLVPLNTLKVEVTSEAVYQMTHSTPLLAAVIGSIFSIAFFNFSGVTVTQQASAVSRSTIDVSRTILIWGVELLFGWNTFNPLQLVGFIVVAIGTMLYNRLIVVQMLEPHNTDELKCISKPYELKGEA